MPTCPPSCTAFTGNQRVASGPMATVILAAKAWMLDHPGAPCLVIRDDTCQVVDLEGASLPEVATPRPAQAKPGRGRPRLGVVAREVTLFERHWTWLKAQPGGASAMLRRLVDEACRAEDPEEAARLAQERAHRAMAILAGGVSTYEDALRALYASDAQTFRTFVRDWPRDVRDYIFTMAAPAFPGGMRS